MLSFEQAIGSDQDVTQARIVCLGENELLVVACRGGMYVTDTTGTRMIFTFHMQGRLEEETVNPQYMRGITALISEDGTYQVMHY